ncbi:MAG: serine/threonine protein phosphatase [Lachnospiraceae bacterium]|nr:serine/threonine protein phosphatase [Lachnospiraceae bacterium]
MATYVISDIHGEYDLFINLLEKINLKDDDTLYILGDILDRGPHPIKAVLKIMEMPNAICIVGNHEVMALECLEFLMQEVTENSIETMDEILINNLMTWLLNGCETTIQEFRAQDHETQVEIIEFLKDFSVYEEITVNDTDYLLVHAGLGNYFPEKAMEDYSLHELVWDRAEYDVQYFPDKYVVTGHTPTQFIDDNPKPGYIFKKNNHIAIDCGAHIPDGRLAAICLDTGEEFYAPHENE